MSRPCIECPFRKQSLRGWLGGLGDAMDVYRASQQEGPFSCHAKNDGISDFEDYDVAPCVGRLMFATNCGKIFRDPVIERLRQELVDDHDEVLSNPKEFLDHHTV